MYIKNYIKKERMHIALNMLTLISLFLSIKLNSIVLFCIIVAMRMFLFLDYFTSIRKEVMYITSLYRRDELSSIADYKLDDVWKNKHSIEYMNFVGLNDLDNIHINRFVGSVYILFPFIDIVIGVSLFIQNMNIINCIISIPVAAIIMTIIASVGVFGYIAQEELFDLKLYKHYSDSKRDYYTRNYNKIKELIKWTQSNPLD